MSTTAVPLLDFRPLFLVPVVQEVVNFQHWWALWGSVLTVTHPCAQGKVGNTAIISPCPALMSSIKHLDQKGGESRTAGESDKLQEAISCWDWCFATESHFIFGSLCSRDVLGFVLCQLWWFGERLCLSTSSEVTLKCQRESPCGLGPSWQSHCAGISWTTHHPKKNLSTTENRHFCYGFHNTPNIFVTVWYGFWGTERSRFPKPYLLVRGGNNI